LTAFLKGLELAGYVVGRNVAIEYRSAAGHYERLPALAAELVGMRVAVIAATGGEVPARAAEDATTQIPIVFTVGSDPVKAGLVTAINRPGHNATGDSLLAYEIDGKRLQLLHELVPLASTIGVLVFASSPSLARTESEMQAAAAANSQRLVMLKVSSGSDLETVFASLRPQSIDALLVTTSPYFEGRRNELVALAQRHSVPALYPWRDYVTAGGLNKLRNELRIISTSGPLCRSSSQGREAIRSAGGASYEVGVDRQSQDRQDARPRRANFLLAPRRRGDRMNAVRDILVFLLDCAR
jgi:putative tryptophan/tyrosine transport system substrate-binding protein